MSDGLTLSLAGLPVRIGPEATLSSEEWRFLDPFRSRSERGGRHSAESGGRQLADFVLRLVDEPSSSDAGKPARGEAAEIVADGHLLRVRHQEFDIELDVHALSGKVFRRSADGAALGIALRTALSLRLPFEEGVSLHAAATVVDGCEALVFHGPSGAGKSTLAGVSPFPVLSDELVVIRLVEDEPHVFSSGFWGTLGDREALRSGFPLRALLTLGKGRSLSLERLEFRESFRSLVRSILTPPWAPAWQQSLLVIRRLLAASPAFRMDWNPSTPLWGPLLASLPYASRGSTRREESSSGSARERREPQSQRT